MSTGKRLAKRSILGTKVMVPGVDGRYKAGFIQALKTCETDPCSSSVVASGGQHRYSVRLEDSGRAFEFGAADIVGPGFSSVSGVHLLEGQKVFVTHNNREVSGRIVRHDVDSQDVLLAVQPQDGGENEETVLVKIEDVRLLESRKSARLVNSDTDFSKLADVGTSGDVADPAAGGSRKGSKAIEVPRSDYVQIAGSRKRRTSENVADDEEVLSECSAAMLLMKLSCSPQVSSSLPSHRAPYVDLPSPAGSSDGSGHHGVDSGSSSGMSSAFRSATPSPPLSSSANDEGIVKDLSIKLKRTLFQCTFPGCHCVHTSVPSIEAHVRKEHLDRPESVDDIDEEERDHEEEFYYTEIETDEVPAFPPMVASPPSGHMAALSLADHLDMARPAHEAPQGGPVAVRRQQMAPHAIPHPHPHFQQPGGLHQRRRIATGGSNSSTCSSSSSSSLLSRSLPNHASSGISIAASSTGSPSKLILISPPVGRPVGHHPSPSSASSSSPLSPTGIKSPTKRREGKKCRKVYGLEQRDLWCTQCKWKKACARFGPGAQLEQQQQPQVSTTATSLLVTAPATKAIKF